MIQNFKEKLIQEQPEQFDGAYMFYITSRIVRSWSFSGRLSRQKEELDRLEEKKKRELLESNAERCKTINRYHFNCWGATAFMHGLIEKPLWLGEHQMEDILDQNTIQSSLEEEIRPGDILVYRMGAELMHTAVALNEKKVWHKPGGNSFEEIAISRMLKKYPGYGSLAEKRKVAV